MAVEVEITLAIVADDPAAAADRIATVRTLLDFVVVPGPVLEIRDRYFDTPDRSLRRRRLALRLRRENGRTLLTVKGPETAVATGAPGRLEIEAPWSSGALATAVAALAERGVALGPPPPGVPDPGPAITVMQGLGLETVQERSTRRALGIVERRDGSAVGELAVDRVTYHLRDRPVEHHEVEIEARDGALADRLGAAGDELARRFAGTLVPWPHGKLATGLALERLLEEGRLDALLVDGRLSPAAYAVIGRVLQDGSPPAE